MQGIKYDTLFNIDSHTPIPLLQNYLLEKEWITPEEHIQSTEKPGEGNMNVVLRIRTNTRSFILKQSRPYVQKYQQIAAPLERIEVERDFYETVKSSALNAHIPKILGYDAETFVMILEDLGHCEDMTLMYAKKSFSKKALEKLVFILGLIHKKKVPADFPKNLEMRYLNHQHIFVLPFLEDNGFQLDDVQPGLQELSMSYKKDTGLKTLVDHIGKIYLSEGHTLIHGDYYPGSWMTEGNNLYVIDPEFGFVGFAEFDLGVMVAHLILATHKPDYMDTILEKYEGKADRRLVSQVAGIEIMRRLIGLAQLPLVRSIEEKEYLLQMAHKMILV
ncbi:phosphotransferase [Ulvibacterium marinum]|uniref:phosphotransferase n=1 Tax=Ulvibacterium marinum TaxID=2419782 RepID=UPI0024959CB8|nr:phosphotransferase [Ulvibacterium marinum]